MATTALVLGAGGTVGMAYHAGVLRALREEAGFEAADAEVIIGTSAGSVVGAYLRTGWTTDDLWQMAMGTHASLAGLSPAEQEARRRGLFTPAWASPVELVTRGLGSAYAAGRSLLPFPDLKPPAAVARRFPAGLFSMATAEQQLPAELGDAWPERPLLLSAFDLGRRRRIVLGDAGSPVVPLHRAVLASCAIPALYRPVREAGMTLVDGGVTSSTSLDLVTGRGVERAIVVAPMAYDPDAAPNAVHQLTRRMAARALSREARQVRDVGIEVQIFRPCGAEIATHGANLMRQDTSEAIARAAYDCTARAVAGSLLLAS